MVSVEVIKVIYFVFSPMSMAASLFIVFSFGCLPRLRSNGLHFVFFQAACDLMFAAAKLISALSPNDYFNETEAVISSPGSLCSFTGWMGQFFGEATTAWNMMITLRIFLVFWKPTKAKHIKSWWFHIYVWGWSSLTSFLLLGLDQYGPTTDGCWIKGRKNYFRLFFFAVPIFVYFTCSVLVLLFVWIKLSRLRKEAQSALNQFEWRFKFQMIAYLLIFIVFWTPPIILRILEYAGVNLNWILYVDALSLVIQGMANALVWVCSRSFCEAARSVLSPGDCCTNSNDSECSGIVDSAPPVYVNINSEPLSVPPQAGLPSMHQLGTGSPATPDFNDNPH